MQNIPDNLFESSIVKSVQDYIGNYLETGSLASLQELFINLPDKLISAAENIRIKKAQERGQFKKRIFWIKNETGEGKLVRDLIPEIIQQNEGKIANTRILDTEEYLKELRIKLEEELKEFLEAVERETNEKQLEEFADILEVIKALENIIYKK